MRKYTLLSTGFVLSGAILCVLGLSLPENTASARGVDVYALMARVGVTPKPRKPMSAMDRLFDGRTDIRPEHQKALREVFALFPDRCFENGKLKNLYVRYDEATLKSRGLAGASTIILSGLMDLQQFIAVAIHETTHFVALSCFPSTQASGVSAFSDGTTPIYNDNPIVEYLGISFTDTHTRRKGDSDANSASRYSLSDAHENLAEMAAAVVLQGEQMSKWATKNAVLQRKIDWVKANLFDEPVGDFATGTYAANGTTRPWDITVLPYQRNQTTLIAGK